ncbi:hypothetical protein ACIA58_04920 [Kribbella sp. NPDC051586]|uniref:hypothetical protein n=1 Tax=Kribbella sp. NPDC051586 TaxID=3364118 RepID=UPI003793A627
MTARKRRALPVVFLLLAAPLVAEVLWGTTRLSAIGGLLIQIGLYGCGALLIREVTVRWGGGLPTVLLLGAAYAIVEEALVEPFWFTPNILDHPYGVAFGVFWTYALWNIGYHALFSIAIPIVLTGLVFPAWRDHRLLHRPGTIVTAAVYVLNAAVLGMLWYSTIQEQMFHVPARVQPGRQLPAVVVIVALVWLARRAAPRRFCSTAGRRLHALGLWSVLATCALFGLLWMAASGDRMAQLPFVVPVAVALVATGVVIRTLGGWAAPTDRQMLAACTGALVVQMAAGFRFTGLTTTADIVGKAVLDVVALGLLVVLARRSPAR